MPLEQATCPACAAPWDLNDMNTMLRSCCCKMVCSSCGDRSVGECSLCGERIPITSEEAVTALRRHVEAGNPAAIVHLGQAYERGLEGGVPQSYDEAARLYQSVVDGWEGFKASHPEAMAAGRAALYSLGRLHINGQGVALDLQRAALCFLAASDGKFEGGHVRAQNNLGEMYREGRGVEQDDAEAAEYYKMAAIKGLAEAECNLGGMYAMGRATLGRGDDADDDEATRLFASAAVKGYEPAVRALAMKDTPAVGG